MSSEPIVGRFSINELIKNGVITAHKDGNFGSLYPRIDDFVDDGFPLLTAKVVNGGRIDFDAAQKLSKEKAASIPYGFIHAGDVLLSHNATVGRVAVVPEFSGRALVGTSLTYFRLDISRLLPRYLAAFFESRDFQNQLSAVMGLSTRNQVPITAQRLLEVELPSFHVQGQISEMVGALDDRITLLRETNATLEAIAQALFKSWFVDFDPVRAKQQGIAPEGMDEATAALFPDSFEESKLGLVPSEWGAGFLENWLTVLETGRRPKGGVSGIESGVPSIGAESVIRLGQFDFSKTKFVSHEFFAKMKSGELQSRDVLLYKDGGKPGVFLPRVAMFGDGFPFEQCAINEHVFRMRLRKPFNQTFLYFWLWSDAIMHELKHRGGKAAIPGINQSDVKVQMLLVPTESVLRKFDDLTSPLISQVLNNAKNIQTLAALRDTLLPRLISGQLRLPEAEALLEVA